MEKKYLDQGEKVYAALPEADEIAKVLEVYQSNLGSCRDACDDSGQVMWGRIERCLAALRAAPPAPQGLTAQQVEDALLDAGLPANVREEIMADVTAPAGVAVPRCECCGYLVTQSEHKGCIRAATPAQEHATDLDALADLIVGMSVSVDVSTGDHDSGNRYFGEVTEVQEDGQGKHRVILLVQDPEPNFTLAAQEHATQLAGQCERKYISPVRTVADLASNLLLMDQSLPIYGAQYIEHQGRRRAIAVSPTVSRERINDGRWIGEGDTLNAAVIWTRAEQPAAPGQAQEEAPAPAAPAAPAVDAREANCRSINRGFTLKPGMTGEPLRVEISWASFGQERPEVRISNGYINGGGLGESVAVSAALGAANLLIDEAERTRNRPEIPAVFAASETIYSAAIAAQAKGEA